MNNQIAKLPKNPVNGTEVFDRYGNIWQFDSKSNAWISKGVISPYPTVSEDNDGLVDPETYSRLIKLQQTYQTTDLTQVLKIAPGTDAYWYYFRSSDKCIRFKPENESTLRIEVDKGRLYQILSKNQRPGSKGSKGKTGEKGENGVSSTDPCAPAGEPVYSPSSINKNKLDFAIFTPIPLIKDGPIPLPNNRTPEISIRLYKILDKGETSEQLQTLSSRFTGSIALKLQHTRDILIQRAMGVKYGNLCDIQLSKVIQSPQSLDSEPSITIDVDPENPSNISIEAIETISIDIESTKKAIKFDMDTQIICGSIYLTEPGRWSDEWCIKSRQRGPDGLNGSHGERRIKIETHTIDGTNIEATCPIVNVRLDNESPTLYTLCANLLDETCANKVLIDNNTSGIVPRDIFKSTFAAAEVTLEDCKYIHKFNIKLPDDDIPDLEFVSWTPQPGCFRKRNFNRHKYNWIPTTDNNECSDKSTWYSPTGIRRGKYPWQIMLPQEPSQDECCQEDFFYCPNVQDGPCSEEPLTTPTTGVI